MAPSSIELINPETELESLRARLSTYDKAAQEREQIIQNLRSFTNNVLAMLDCSSDNLDDGILALNKLIEKNHRLTKILTEIHETNSSIPFSIYAKYL